MNLEERRLQVELIRLDATVAEQEFKIDECFAEVERIKAHITILKKRQEDIKAQLAQKGGAN